jgi:hypothetical protein
VADVGGCVKKVGRGKKFDRKCGEDLARIRIFCSFAGDKQNSFVTQK